MWIRFLNSQDLHIQQAALTGESMPAEKFVPQDPLATIDVDASRPGFPWHLGGERHRNRACHRRSL